MLVLDASVAVSWCFRDQHTAYTRGVLEALVDGVAVVPALWLLEVANVTSLAERRGLLPAADRTRYLQLLGGLRTRLDHASAERIWGDVYELATSHDLTIYDARYLELARRMQMPLASIDGELVAAAQREGVPMFPAALG